MVRGNKSEKLRERSHQPLYYMPSPYRNGFPGFTFASIICSAKRKYLQLQILLSCLFLKFSLRTYNFRFTTNFSAC